MRLYRKASWEDGGSEVAAAVALLALRTGNRLGARSRRMPVGRLGSGTTCLSTATVLMACPEDRDADFFRRQPAPGRGNDLRSAVAPGAVKSQPNAIQRDVSGHTGRPF